MTDVAGKDNDPAADKQEQRRRFYRVDHPLQERPKLVIGDNAYDILDISEGGTKFVTPQFPEKAIEGVIEAHITFSDGEEIAVKGRVVRYELAMEFEELIPGKIMAKEQIKIIKHYHKPPDRPAKGN